MSTKESVRRSGPSRCADDGRRPHPRLRGPQPIRALVGDLLRDEGYEVSLAADVASALTALTREPHDAVVLDLPLRGESGLALLTAMRAEPALAGVPVLLLSGDFDEASDREAAHYDVDAVLPKPFEPEALGTAVGRLLAGRDQPAG